MNKLGIKIYENGVFYSADGLFFIHNSINISNKYYYRVINGSYFGISLTKYKKCE